jgi:glutamine amidotransferase
MVQRPIMIVDYDAGNLHSVVKAVEASGLDGLVSDRPEDFERVSGVILPGVGAFPDCMAHLRERQLVEPLLRWLRADRPFLGICLGLQILFEWGQEGGISPGLGVLPGMVRRIQAGERKIPHMGWNALHLLGDSPLLAGVQEGAYVYFVHSFHAVPTRPEDLLATVEYGEAITAAVARGRLFGVQFHPEKSSAIGQRVLANFGAICREDEV